MRNNWLLILVTLITGALVGFGISSSTTAQPKRTVLAAHIVKTDNNSLLDNKTAVTYLAVNNALIKHTVMKSMYLEQLYDDQNTSASESVLVTNADDIADIIGTVYGTKAKEEFSALWKQHMDQYAVYTKALKDDKQTEMTKAKKELDVLATQFGVAMHTISPTIDAVDMTRLMKEHTSITLLVINAYAKNDQSTIVSQSKAGQDQASEMATFLMQSMIADKPGVFK